MRMGCAGCSCVTEQQRVSSCARTDCCCCHLPLADGVGVPGRPSWSTHRQALAVVGHRPHLRASLRIALVVGSVLFAINQLDVVLHGDATTVTWLKGAVTYVVPFVVSNLGILAATRSRP